MLRDPVANEMIYIAHAITRLGQLRPALNYDECLRLAEMLRDAGDALDHGAAQRNPPTPAAQLEQVEIESPPATGEVQVPVRQLSALRRPPARPARPRNICAAD
jgi:hypothetical protein